MDPRNPLSYEARDANSDYIVYYAQIPKQSLWNMERVVDGVILASGSLEAMLSLLTIFPNSRRASLYEDMLRYTPGVFFLEFKYGK